MTDRDLLMHAARTDFLTFARLMFGVLNPGVRFEHNWHLEAIAAALERAIHSRTVRQIVTLPPRSLKSFLISEAFVAFLLGQNPGLQIICVTYSEKLSETQSLNTARIMRSPLYKRIFPNTCLERDTMLYLTTSKGGSRRAASVGGSITGFGGDWVIIDDPMNAPDAHSKSARDSVIAYFDRALSSRVNDETSSRFIAVMQRLHQDDLVGHLLAKGGWDELRLPATATGPALIDLGHGRQYRVEPGDLLHPRRLPLEVLDRKKLEVGSIVFQAQYQQDPVPADGNIVHAEWLRFYTNDPRGADARIVLSLDTAVKTNPANDYSVCTVWASRPQSHHLLHVWRAKVEYTQLKPIVIQLYQHYQADHLLIEDHNNGATLIQELRSFGIPATGRTPNRDKETRLVAATPFMESGQMYLPVDAPWLQEFVTELLAFPGRHDDQVDSVSQYFAWIAERSFSRFEYSFLDDPVTPAGNDEPARSLGEVLASLPRY